MVKARDLRPDVLRVDPVTAPASLPRGWRAARPAPPPSRRLLAGVERGDLQAGLTIALAASAAIHLAVTLAHLRDDAGSAVFFVSVALLQLGAAALCARRACRSVVWASAALSVAIAGVWFVSRTAGLPVGPDAGQAQAVGLADVVSTGYELVAATVAVALGTRLRTGQPLRMRLTPRSGIWAASSIWITLGAIFVGH